jgi:hypothetical protein
MQITLEHIEFTKDEIPVSKKVDINHRLYTLEIQYNEVGDFYVAILYDDTDEPLISSKLVYFGNTFHAHGPGLPLKKLIPLYMKDISSGQPENLRVCSETFEDKIRLYLI